MLARKLVSLGAVVATLTLSGVAFSGGGTDNVRLLAFDEKSELLSAWDQVNNQFGTFQHGEFTQHLPGIFHSGPPAIPPDPCIVFMRVYNTEVHFFERHAHRHANPERERALLLSIALLSSAHCNATISSDSTGRLLTFQPHE
jgi:hypothetical protein